MNYLKSIGMLAATALSLIVAALVGDNTVTGVEWLTVGTTLATAASVFAAPNVPGARYTKVILAIIGAVLTASTTFLTDGITLSEWLQIGLAALGAVGVYAAPYQHDFDLAA